MSATLTAPSIDTLIDSHCHLDNAQFDSDRNEMLERADAAGVRAFIVPATHAAEWPRLHEVACTHAALHPVYGLHPMFMSHHSTDDIDGLKDLLAHNPDAVGIGECGLDRVRLNSTETAQLAQRQLFRAQLEIARDTQLPVVIHARDAVEAVIQSIRSTRCGHGMVHSYNGSYEQAKQLIDLGYRLGFGGAMTYTRAKKIRRLITQLPLDSLLLETDSPDQTGYSHAPQRNEPAYLREVFDVMCELRQEPAEDIAHATTENAVRLFALPDIRLEG